MDHFEIEVGEVDQPQCLMMVECLWLSEISEILMIRKHLYQKRGAMKVMPPRFQGVDDSKELMYLFSVSQSLYVKRCWSTIELTLT